MIEDYKATRRILRSLKPNEIDKPKVNSMISSTSYVIDWLETGIRPGATRGIERRAGYERELLCDPLILQSYHSGNRTTSHLNASESDIERIELALSILTEKEKEVFLMVHAGCLSQERVSQLTGYPRTTVQSILIRCKQKMRNTEQLALSM